MGKNIAQPLSPTILPGFPYALFPSFLDFFLIISALCGAHSPAQAALPRVEDSKIQIFGTTGIAFRISVWKRSKTGQKHRENALKTIFLAHFGVEFNSAILKYSSVFCGFRAKFP